MFDSTLNKCSYEVFICAGFLYRARQYADDLVNSDGGSTCATLQRVIRESVIWSLPSTVILAHHSDPMCQVRMQCWVCELQWHR